MVTGWDIFGIAFVRGKSISTEAVTRGVLWKNLSENFCDIHRNTPVLKSLFNKFVEFADVQACKPIKKRLQHKFFLVNIAKF